MDKKFPPEKLARLNDPNRLVYLPPDLIWRTLDPGAAHTAVEIGAGTGFFASRFAGRLKGGKLYACDILDVMIEWMRENLGALSDMVVPLKMEESSVPLPDGIADLVYMLELHHELEEPAKVIGEARRLLAEGGKLMIIDWKKEVETPTGPPLSIRVNAKDIVAQVEKGGFSSVKSHDVLPYHNFVVGEKGQQARGMRKPTPAVVKKSSPMN